MTIETQQTQTPPADQTQATQEVKPTQQTTETPTPTASDSTASPADTTNSTDLGTEEAPVAATTDLGAEDEAAPEPAPAGAEFHGAPEATADYEPFVAPDGMTIDEGLAEAFKPIARELNLNQKGAQKLVDLKAKDVQAQTKRWGDHLVELKNIAQADPEIGGAEYPKAVAVAKGAISKYGTPAFRKMLNDYGVGAHPEMIKFMRKVGLAMGETPVLESGGNAGVRQLPLHEILYKD